MSNNALKDAFAAAFDAELSAQLKSSDDAHDNDPFNILHEQHEVAIRCARRCAYDLGHAASLMERGPMRDEMTKRASRWIKLFQSGNSMKDYVHRLHKEIEDLELENKRLRKGQQPERPF